MNIGHGEVWGVQRGVDGHKIRFSLEAGFLVLSRRIAKRVSSLIWVSLGERPAAARENCLQEGEGPVHRKRVLDGST